MDYKKYIRPGKTTSDITPLIADSIAFNNLIQDLCNLFQNIQIDKVAGIEAMGFVLGAAVANKLNLGLVLIRKDGLQNDIFSEKFKDYTGKEKELSIHKDAIKEGEKILIIDDWVETGGAIKTVIGLINKCKGEIVGIGVLMDDSNDEMHSFLQKYNYKYLDKVAPGDNF